MSGGHFDGSNPVASTFLCPKIRLKVAESNVKIEDIGSRLDLVSYFNVVGIPYPGNMEDIADALSKEKFIRHNSAGNL